MTTALSKDGLAAAYVAARDRVAVRDAETKEANHADKELMGKIETYFKGVAAVEGVDSWKTAHGTIYLSRIDSVKLADPDSYFEYVVDNEAWDLIEKRASKSGVRGFLEAHGSMPPGAELSTRIEVNIRRPSAT
jgi:hypothetical protein